VDTLLLHSVSGSLSSRGMGPGCRCTESLHISGRLGSQGVPWAFQSGPHLWPQVHGSRCLPGARPGARLGSARGRPPPGPAGTGHEHPLALDLPLPFVSWPVPVLHAVLGAFRSEGPFGAPGSARSWQPRCPACAPLQRGPSTSRRGARTNSEPLKHWVLRAVPRGLWKGPDVAQKPGQKSKSW